MSTNFARYTSQTCIIKNYILCVFLPVFQIFLLYKVFYHNFFIVSFNHPIKNRKRKPVSMHFGQMNGVKTAGYARLSLPSHPYTVWSDLFYACKAAERMLKYNQ